MERTDRMDRIRNTVIIIILCIVGAQIVVRRPHLLRPWLSGIQNARDAVAGSGVRSRPGPATPTEAPTAGSPIVAPLSNTLDNIPPPPRGGISGGVDPLPAQTPPPLSPHSP
jgi:hypothetical protein